MKKLCVGIIAAIIFLGLSLVVFVHPDKLITDYSHKVVNLLTTRRSFQGITVAQLSFANAKLNALDAISWHDVDAEITLSSKNNVFSGKKIKVHVDNLTVELESFFKHRINFLASRITVNALAIDQDPSLGEAEVGPGSYANTQQFDSLTDGKMSLSLDINFFSKDEAIGQLTELLHDIKGLIVSGRCKSPITLTAVISFRVRDENVKSLLSVELEGVGYTVVLNKESLSVVSLLFDEKLTDPEVEILSKNPLRTPRLLRIKDEAQSVAENAHHKNKIVPEDAYRHVLWSYLLTKEYGPDFAQKITDAHEHGVTDNSEAEHQMDFTNNRIGRQYAMQDYRKHDILMHVLDDTGVVRVAK